MHKGGSAGRRAARRTAAPKNSKIEGGGVANKFEKHGGTLAEQSKQPFVSCGVDLFDDLKNQIAPMCWHS